MNFQPVNRSNHFSTLFTNIPVKYNMIYNNCNNSLCYTYNKQTNYIYKPHSALGRVGTTSSAYMWQRKRI